MPTETAVLAAAKLAAAVLALPFWQLFRFMVTIFFGKVDPIPIASIQYTSKHTGHPAAALRSPGSTKI